MSNVSILDPRAFVESSVLDAVSSAGGPVGALKGKKIGIRIDEMWESWEWVADEWASSLRGLGAEPRVWRAPIVKGAKVESAGAEFADFNADVDAAIVGLCNCGSCSFWAIHDALGSLDSGLPTLVVATAHFERLARMLATKGGRPDVRMVVLPYPLEGRKESEVREIARQYFDQALETFGAVK